MKSNDADESIKETTKRRKSTDADESVKEKRAKRDGRRKTIVDLYVAARRVHVLSLVDLRFGLVFSHLAYEFR